MPTEERERKEEGVDKEERRGEGCHVNGRGVKHWPPRVRKGEKVRVLRRR